jgi:hypothetical protein
MVRLAHSDVLFDAELAAFRLTARNAACLIASLPKELTMVKGTRLHPFACFVAVVAFIGATANLAIGQVLTGNLSGTVKDASRAVVPSGLSFALRTGADFSGLGRRSPRYSSASRLRWRRQS